MAIGSKIEVIGEFFCYHKNDVLNKTEMRIVANKWSVTGYTILL